jgi:glycosyltransferase involved in cell wall biosynthesis
MPKTNLVTAVITTRNEEIVLPTLLESLKLQSYPNIEVIVVDNNSTDKTTAIARKYTTKVFQKGPERSVQRNYGAEKSRGKYLLFLDADMELSPNVIQECVNEMASHKAYAAIIPEVSVGKTFWEKVKAFERSFYQEQGSRWTDSARFYDKDIFTKAGRYDEKITGPEDWDLSESVRSKGWKMVRITSYIYHHERIPGPWKMAQKMYYYGLKAHRSIAKQKVGIISPKTIYLLRREFYTGWKSMLLHPILTIGMVVMLTFQLAGGGIGYFIGKFKNL